MGMGRTDDERRRIVQYWTLLELFNPQPVPKSTQRSTRPEDEQIVEWVPGKPLPWESLDPPKPTKKNTKRAWQHTVYLGVYDLESSYARLQHAFGEERDAYDARRAGQSACAAVVLDENGVLSVESTVLSSALWAIAKLKAGSPARSPHWAADFPVAARAFTEQIDEVEGARRDLVGADRPLPHDTGSLPTLLRVAHTASGISAVPDLVSPRIFIKSVVRAVDGREDGGDNDFLNSFYLEDLTTIQKDLRAAAPPMALAQYLTPSSEVREDQRIDVMTSHRVVDSDAGIARLPLGRWPAKPTHGLALRQQFAVNAALCDLSRAGGLLGVNGPPGTGKTTMLRDILAGNVVDRARQLARLSRPEHAFSGEPLRWGSGVKRRSFKPLRPELTGYEMVVASANNGAVENVSSEIPARDAIAEPWQEHAEYFSDIATATLGASEAGKHEDTDAWGLIAARLGNKKNRSGFISGFWFDRMPPADGTSPHAGKGMLTRLKEWESGASAHRSWAEARAEFTAQEARVEELVRQWQKAQNRIERLTPAMKAVEDRGRQVQNLSESLTTARRAMNDHQGDLEHADSELTDATAACDRRLAARPGFLETLFTFGGAIREWRARVTSVEQRRDAAERAAAQARVLDQRLAHQERTLEADVSRAVSELQHAEHEVHTLRRHLAEDNATFGDGYPGAGWTGRRRELNAPWLDPVLDTARSELFLAALRLHEDFLANAATEMKKALGAAIDVVGGRAPRHLEPEKILAAWQLFFFVVPMVSTTFASFGRMFAGLERESLGWLFIDEAGQASPQDATGAIWRSQRVIAVGDPLQLEPVVTMPHKAQRDIAQAFDVGAEWTPPKASVQTLTDRVSPLGTTLRHGEEEVWVSAPLTVHRRCDDPMFSLCNAVAYDGIMVSGVHRTLDDPEDPDLFDSADGPLIPTSRWLHVPAQTKGTHLQENQFVKLRSALDSLTSSGVDPSTIIAISPFRAVALQLRGLTRSFPGMSGGTIHTAQGREADIVFLVLGGDPAAPGAMAWASETVNLVNVATSRAKRRLYVIGDRGQWSRYPYFRELSDSLGPTAAASE